MNIYGHPLTRRGDAAVLTLAIVTGVIAGTTVNHLERGLTHVQTPMPHVRNIQRSADRSGTSSRTRGPRDTVPATHRGTTPTTRHISATSSRTRRPAITITGQQFTCLRALWDRESHWNPKAHNPTSSAAGIPQLLGMRTSLPAAEQIRIGLAYVTHRYGTACKAWAFWQGHGYY